LSIDDFVRRLGTQSALVTLGSPRLTALLNELRAELSASAVTLTGGTYTIFARDPDVDGI
jgi:hypothetical protein